MKITDVNNISYDIDSENYENIFNIYLDKDNNYYFNLLKKVEIPEELDPDVFDYYQTLPIDTYPNISYQFYKSVKLWWLICAANNIDNPMKQPVAGTVLKIIKPYYVNIILTKMTENEK
jgi:hypothetical protein